MSFLNGRVDAITKSPLNIVNYNQYKTENPSSVIGRNISQTPVSELFFSNENTNMLQKGIINRVFNYSNGNINIGNQNDTELKIVMRSIYYQFSKNNNSNIVKQVKELNIRVLDWCVQEIIANVELHQKFKKDISTLPVPMARSQLSTKKGTRTLEFKSFI